ncbi:MAG: F0F1 ATP synthase subunit B [Halanaerobiales bacterium]|nr:F0F1 ATP synthase subunit B [Halanaerobiales bacterium]
MVEINTTLLWQVINFLVLLWLLKRYLYGPIKEILDKRENMIKSEINEAEERHQEAIELKEEYKAELKRAQDKSSDIIDKAEQRARERAKEIINQAKEKANKIEIDKLQEIKQAKVKARKEIRDQFTEVTLMAAAKMIGQEIDKRKHEDLMSEYIDKIDKKKLGDVQ